MKSILPFDELNALEKKIAQHFGYDGHIKSKEDCEDIIDELLDLYLLTLAEAIEAVNQQFGTSIECLPQDVQEMVYKAIDGATWPDRVWTWFETGGTLPDIMRIAETEMTRIGNAAALDIAIKAGAREKTWLTMLDDRVRDTHTYLESVTVPIDARFYTYDGDSALAPGGFTNASNNCGCRCELRFK